MSALSRATVLDSSAKRINLYAMVRASAANPATDDALVGGMRAQRLAYREQMRELNNMDSDAYKLDIEALARSLRILEDDIHSDVAREIFGDPYMLELSAQRLAVSV